MKGRTMGAQLQVANPPEGRLMKGSKISLEVPLIGVRHKNCARCCALQPSCPFHCASLQSFPATRYHFLLRRSPATRYALLSDAASLDQKRFAAHQYQHDRHGSSTRLSTPIHQLRLFLRGRRAAEITASGRCRAYRHHVGKDHGQSRSACALPELPALRQRRSPLHVAPSTRDSRDCQPWQQQHAHEAVSIC